MRRLGQARAAMWKIRQLRRYAPILPALLDVVPPDLEQLDPETYIPDTRTIGHVALRSDEQLEALRRWTVYDDLFRGLRDDARINTRHPGGDRIHNGSYPTPDAEVYAAMIADRRPQRIVEIGAGYSTLVARHTLRKLGIDCELVVIDPEPRTDIADSADRLVRRRVEDVPGELQIGGDGLLFIDSTHVVRSGGDVPYLFCDVVPRLPPGALVHVHDIFVPFDYPPAYRRRLYGEQYVLLALLAGGERFRVEFATHHMVRAHGNAMRDIFGPAVGVDPLHFGGSFWFTIS